VIAEAFRLAPEIPRGLLIGQGGGMAGRAASVGAGVVVPSFTLLNDTAAREIHAHGLGLWTYTVDEESDMRRMIDWNVDGMITNYPDRLKKILVSR
jgi:glycerophosphoryl diester phosphodiesterase